MKRIYVVMPSMGGGGAEKMISYVCNKLVEDKDKEVILILFEKSGKNLEKLNVDLKIIDLKLKVGILGVLKLIKILKKEMPDIVLLGLGPLNAVFSPFIPFFRRIKFIARETNIPSVINELQGKKKRIYKLIDLLYKTTYNLFDVIIAQSQDMRRDLEENYHISPSKIIVINNLIDTEMISKKQLCDLDKIDYLYRENKIYGLAIGRLSQQKGYDLLLKQLKNIDKSVVIYILGNGELRDQLIDTIKKYKLEKNIKILPFDENPYKYLEMSDFYILSSRVEGFPNALIEALGCGVPAIVNSCKGGINEIIIKGVNGKILDFNNEIDLFEEISEIIKYDRQCIKKDAFSRFNKEIILEKYMQIFK